MDEVFSEGGNIVHAIGAFCAGGAEKFVTELAESMEQMGVETAVVALSSRTDDAGRRMVKRLEQVGVSWAAGPTERVGFRSALWFSRTVRQFNPRIVHLHTPNTELAYMLSLLGCWRRHDLFRTIHNTKVIASPLARLALVVNDPRESIACGVATYEAYRLRMRRQLVLISNGVSFHWPIKTGWVRSDLCKSLGLIPELKHYVHVGKQGGQSLDTCQKAQDVLIAAWKQVRMTEKGACLHLLGEGNLQAQLKSLAAGDPGIFFQGVTDRVHDWLQVADCFVMPSRFEGLPIAAIEALGTGVQCIFSEIDALARIAEVSAISFVEPGSVESLKFALEASLGRGHPAISEVESVRQTYEIRCVAERYLAVYGINGPGHRFLTVPPASNADCR